MYRGRNFQLFITLVLSISYIKLLFDTNAIFNVGNNKCILKDKFHSKALSRDNLKSAHENQFPFFLTTKLQALKLKTS